MTKTSTINLAAELLKAGRLVAFPTETVYGLGANALDAKAVRRIFQAKGRPSTSPLIVHVSSRAMAKRVVAKWPPTAEKLAKQFWPGPLTLVLPKAKQVPTIVTAGLQTVGVRMPAHPIALALIRKTRLPLAAPSANRFTELSPVTAEQVTKGLGTAVDLVIDGGPSNVGIESTVLSLAGSTPILLRPGMITREHIEAIIGPIELAQNAKDGEAHASPGQHSRHYSPRTPLRLGAPSKPAGTVYLWWSKKRPAQFPIPMPADPAQYAAQLYDTLHRADELHAREIVIEPVPNTGQWDGIRDRLLRAATQTIIA